MRTIHPLRLSVLLFAVASSAFAQDQVASRPASEDGDAVDDVVVVTASRREEQLLNAPATVTVVADDVIGAAPSQSMTELLRLVPGLNIAQTSARDVNITTRAATGTLSDSMLVLLDGRSVYQDLFGFVLWDFLPIDTSEIKQIEVLRGPASAVWGANAMNGVVNVITKTPRELQGTFVRVQFGQFDRSAANGTFDGGDLLSVAATHARVVSDRLAFKVSAGAFLQEAYLRPTGFVPGTTTTYPTFVNRGSRQPRVDARLDYDFADRRQKLVLAGGLAGTEGIIHTGLGPLDIQRGSTFTYGRLTYTRGRLKVQGFVNGLNGDAPAQLQSGLDGQPLPFVFTSQAYDVEVSNVHLWRTRHLVSYGGNLRHNDFNLSFASGHDHRNEAGAYGQDEIFLSERYRWVIGGRVDRFDVLAKAVLSPRTTFLIKPRPSQTLRLSFNRAFRAPSFVNSFLNITSLNRVDLGAAGPFQFPIIATGNDQLREEQLTAYEAGYIGGFGRLTVGAAVYLNRIANMIQFTESAHYTSASPPPGWPLPAAVLDQLIVAGRGLPSQFTYSNFDHVTDRGLELSAEWSVRPTLSTFANYSWQAAPVPSGFDASELNRPPAHRVNLGFRVDRRRYFGDLSASLVDRAYWQDVLPSYQGWTDGYVLVDAGVGLHAGTETTVGLRVTNLLNAAVQQHIFGDIIRRTVNGEVRFHF